MFCFADDVYKTQVYAWKQILLICVYVVACYRSASHDSIEDRTFGECAMERNPSEVPFPVKKDCQPFIWLQLSTAAFPIDVSPSYSGSNPEIPKAMLEVIKEDVSLKERDCTNLVFTNECTNVPVIIRYGL